MPGGSLVRAPTPRVYESGSDWEGGMRVYALIPARSGSKGLPDKNVLEIDGIRPATERMAAALCAVSRGTGPS
jgi:hypothetical protein